MASLKTTITQNNNESYNMTVWGRIPKNHYVSLSQLQFGAYDAVANFNIGRKASVLVMEKMQLRPGRYLLKGCQKINRKRLYLSECIRMLKRVKSVERLYVEKRK